MLKNKANTVGWGFCSFVVYVNSTVKHYTTFNTISQKYKCIKTKSKKPKHIINPSEWKSKSYIYLRLFMLPEPCIRLYMFNDPNHYHNRFDLAINLFWKASKRLNCEYLLLSDSESSKRIVHKLKSFFIYL